MFSYATTKTGYYYFLLSIGPTISMAQCFNHLILAIKHHPSSDVSIFPNNPVSQQTQGTVTDNEIFSLILSSDFLNKLCWKKAKWIKTLKYKELESSNPWYISEKIKEFGRWKETLQIISYELTKVTWIQNWKPNLLT